MKHEYMKTAVMTDMEKVEIVERPIPVPNKNEVLIKIETVGICGSDIHYYESGRIGDFIVEPPFVLGHEAAGIVVALGENITHLVIGDRVAMEPGKTCGRCEYCKSGKYNLCEHVEFFATPPYDGVFQEYVCHEGDLCFKLPENMDSTEGALIEPLAVGFHAAIQGNATVGQTAVVMGAGCIGLVTMMALKYMGVSEVIMVDVIETRLEKALELGADYVINGNQVDAVERIHSITSGNGSHLSIETAGVQETSEQVIHMTRKGGTIVYVGYSASGYVNIPLGRALDKELDIKTVFRYRNVYPLAIDAVASGRIDVKKIVTNEYDLKDVQDALQDSIHNKASIVKGIIRVS